MVWCDCGTFITCIKSCLPLRAVRGSMIRYIGVLFIMVLVTVGGCSEKESDLVYIPSPDFEQSLTIYVSSNSVIVGESTPLRQSHYY